MRSAGGPFSWLLSLGLVLLVGQPMGWLLYTSLTDQEGALTGRHFREALTQPDAVQPLLVSLGISACVGLLCVVVAAPLGWLAARTALPGSRLLRGLVLASFVTPPFLGAFAWELLAAPNSGLLNQWYRGLFGLERGDHLLNIYTVEGLVFVLFLYTFPYVFTLVAGSLDQMPAELEEASSMLGATRWQTALQITLPAVRPAVAAGFLVAFLQAITLFGPPAILALPAGIHTATTRIWSLFQFPARPGLAAALSLLLLAAAVLLLRGQQRLLGRRSYALVGGRGARRRLVELGAWKWPALALFLAVVACSVLLPYAVLLKASFTRIYSDPLTAENLTLRNVRFVFTEFSATRLALGNTFLLAGVSATLGTLLAICVAYLTVRGRAAGGGPLHYLAMAPIAIPGLVLGVGLFLSYTRPPLILYGTLWILLLGYLTKELPAGYQQIVASLKAVHPELEEAGRILGAGRWQQLRHITAPLMRGGILATWCFIFTAVIRELSMTIMLFTSQTKVISVTIYDLKESGDWGAISVLGVTLLLLTFAVVLAVQRWQRWSAYP